MKFSEVAGHTRLKQLLAQAADAGRVSHAQMLCGEEGSGGLPLAVAYAQYLNCTQRQNGDSCGECPSCVKIAKLEHPDLHFVFPVKGGGAGKPTTDLYLPQWRELFAARRGYFDLPEWYARLEMGNQQGIVTQADADELVRKLSFKSFEGGYKTVILWLPEFMREGASNSLLKILEEPWEKTLFLLVSASPDELIETIRSRVQRIDLPPLETQEIAGWLALAGTPADPGTARLSRGSITRALQLASGEGASQEYFEPFTSLMRLCYNDRHMELLEWSEGVASMGREAQKEFLEYTIAMARNSFMLNMKLDQTVYLSGEELKFCTNFAPFIHSGNFESLVRECDVASVQVERNGNPKMIFSHFALTVSKLINRL